MRTVETKVFNYNELSENAKEVAFENWQEQRQSMGYSWSDEVTKIVDHIENRTPIRINQLNYDTVTYNYFLDVSDCDSIDHDKYHLTGLRAAKIALAMYYDITEERLYFIKGTKSYTGQKEFRYLSKDYLSLSKRHRLSAFYGHNQCFTGYCESETFAKGLHESIRNNTSKDYTVLDHFKAAFDRLFTSVVCDCEALQSKEYFVEVDASEYEYLESGEQY